jgi:alpha-mannosidase
MLESFHGGPLPAAQSFASDSGDDVMITAVKGWEDGGGDVIVRAVETTGRTASTRLTLPVAGRSIDAEFGPSQIRTFRVPLDGGDVREVDLLERDLPQPSRPFSASPIDASPDGAAPCEPDHLSSDATDPAEAGAPGQHRLPPT